MIFVNNDFFPQMIFIHNNDNLKLTNVPANPSNVEMLMINNNVLWILSCMNLPFTKRVSGISVICQIQHCKIFNYFWTPSVTLRSEALEVPFEACGRKALSHNTCFTT